MILLKKKKKRQKGGTGAWLSGDKKKNVNTIKNFLVELQKPIVVKVELNC